MSWFQEPTDTRLENDMGTEDQGLCFGKWPEAAPLVACLAGKSFLQMHSIF